MEPDNFDATQIKAKGWRQGSVIPAALADTLCAGEVLPWHLSENEFLVVISQDCDVTSPDFRIESQVELIRASLLPESEKHGNYFWAKNPRRYQLEEPSSGDSTVWQFCIQDRVIVPRNCLLDAEPDGDRVLSPENVKRLCLWVARRYFRVAFADAFNNRIEDAVKKLRRMLKSKGELLTAIYLFVADQEFPDDTPYDIIMYGSMRVEDYALPTRRKEAQEVLDKVEAALASCEGINVNESVLKSEADISIDELRKLKRWDFDDLSVRGERVSDLPDEG